MMYNIQLIFKLMQIQSESSAMIESFAVVDIDPQLALHKPSQQKWISSLQLHTEHPKDQKTLYNSKIINVVAGLYLQINYCEKNRPPIYQIDFVVKPTFEWASIKMPANFLEKFGGHYLCYKTQQGQISQPLTDIDILSTERKRMGQEKDVFIVPAGYKIVTNNPLSHGFMVYKRTKSLLEQSFKPVLFERYPESHKRINHSLLPLFCFPEGIRLQKEYKLPSTYNFILTLETGERIYATCLTFKELLPQNYKNKLKIKVQDTIHYEKAICLLSRFRFTDEFASCLQLLYRLSISSHEVPFNKVIKSLVDKLILPKQLGVNGASYAYAGSTIKFNCNPAYPSASERAIYAVFKFLPVQAIINIFEAIMLEKKVIFVSQSKTMLGHAVQAFLSFIYPFRWEHVLIPILPNTLKEYLAAPVPLIVGIAPSIFDNTIESDCIIVHLDDGGVLNDEDLPPLPEKMEKQLRKRLQTFEIYDEESVKEYLQNEGMFFFPVDNEDSDDFRGYAVRDCFFEFNLTLMKNYKKFWKIHKYKESKETTSLNLTEPQLLSDVFKLQDFLSDLGMTKVGSFGYKFTEGTIFTSFIERRFQFIDDPEFIFFDDSIERKKAKKQTTFIHKIQNIRYKVAEHPEPQEQKKIFTYDKFPSIYPQKIIRQEEIIIDNIGEEEQDESYLFEYLEQEYLVNHAMFEPSCSDDEIDFKIESLLLKKFKRQFEEIKNQKIQKEENFKENLTSTLTGSLHKITQHEQTKTEQIRYFQKIYPKQLQIVEKILEDWPKKSKQSKIFKEMVQKDYYSMFMSHKGQKLSEQFYVGVFENVIEQKNFHILINKSSKIVFVDEESNVYKFQKSKSSRKKALIQVMVPSFKIKSLLNRLIPCYIEQLFTFIFEKMHIGISNLWTIETLMEFQTFIETNKNQN